MRPPAYQPLRPDYPTQETDRWLQSANGKSLFRINRDLRFSKDKTPYRPHLDVAWWQGEHPKTSPAFICRIRPDQVLTGVGVFTMERSRLDQFRASIVGSEGAELKRAVQSATVKRKGVTSSEPSRKRVPKGVDADHPRPPTCCSTFST